MRTDNEYTLGDFTPTGKAISESDLVLFPSIETVLIAPTEIHKLNLFPLCSFPLAIVNENWEGTAHFVAAFFDTGAQTDRAVEHFTQYCEDYSLGFDQKGEAYQLRTDALIFEVSDEYEEYRQEQERGYQKAKNDYISAGLSADLKTVVGTNKLIMQVGEAPMWTQNDETPTDPNGKPMYFIGQLFAGSFFQECQQDIFLFYSPEFRLFVQRFQYT